MYQYRCFVPELLVCLLKQKIEKYQEHEIENLKPVSIFIRGVCLLVDISGFTKLSAEFCSLGKEGIDGLQLATNGYMGKLVEIIYSFGGDIMKFAGDAIICVFYNDMGQGLDNEIISPGLVLRAIRCAEVLREVQTEKLSVHVAISCGEICFGILGGFENRWECLISGSCLEQLSDCLDDASSKQAVLTSECFEIIKHNTTDIKIMQGLKKTKY